MNLPVCGQTADFKVRALFIFKFIDNVSWPQDRKALVIGIINSDKVFSELEARLQQKNPHGMIIKKVTAAQVSACDVVYLPASESRSISQINMNSQGKDVLIITDTDLSGKGSGISFVEEDGRLHFVVNRNALESRGLKISSTLLSLGKQS